jgi:hypothetical protein
VIKFNKESKKGYPNIIPTIYFENETLPGSAKLDINKKIIEESLSLLGTQMIYPLATWFQERSTDFVNKFYPKVVKKEEKPKFQKKPNNNTKKVTNPQPKKVPQPQPCWNCGELGIRKRILSHIFYFLLKFFFIFNLKFSFFFY